MAGVTAWLGWLTVCPALGFPSLATAAMLNLLLVPREDPGFWLGWALLIIGLASAALGYLAVTNRSRIPAGIASGAAYGALCWLIAGAVVMPLLGLAGSPPATGAAVDPMRGSFMMLDLGLGAPIAALISWLLFGAVLGASAVPVPPDPATMRSSVGALRGAVAVALAVVIIAAVGRIALAPASPPSSGTRTLATAVVQSLPQGTDFFSVIELTQPPGATLGPHVHTYSGVAYGLNGVATIGFATGQTAQVGPGDAAFIISGQTHAHRNTTNQLPSALLALLTVALALAAGILALRARWTGLIPAALVLLIAVGVLGILNPWSNDWLFISVRSATGRAAEMPLATATRVFESPSIGPFAPGAYTETLDEITVQAGASAPTIATTGAAVIVVLDGSVAVSADRFSVALGAHGADVIKAGSVDLLSDTGGQPAHVLELVIDPASGG